MTVVINGDTGIDKVSPEAETPGLKFPATQSPSSGANTLDDYEEGTFTGTLEGDTTNPTTPVTATGKYTKVGRLVTFNISFNNFDSTGASGNTKITGLPFSATENNVCSLMSYLGLTFSGTLVGLIAGPTVYSYGVSSGAGGWGRTTHNAGSGRYLYVSGSYMV